MRANNRVGAYDTIRSWHGIDSTWMREGACNLPTITVEQKQAFFADTVRGAEARAAEQEAKAMCGKCPVKARCLEFAIEGDMRGIWGGLNERERNRLVKGRLQ